jgi:hypothetical protein
LWVLTIAVVISPGLAILWVRPIARLLHYLLWPGPEVTSRSREQLACEEPTGVSAPRR